MADVSVRLRAINGHLLSCATHTQLAEYLAAMDEIHRAIREAQELHAQLGRASSSEVERALF